MKDLLDSIENLQKSTLKDLINVRIKEFSSLKKKNEDHIFKELCFCIMTANCGAAKCIEIHEKIGDNFLTLEENQLANKFKELGYRFPNIRSNYILKAREKKTELWNKINNDLNSNELREWIVKNIKGIGYKEGSHFLRNIGFRNYAIIDFHIVDVLVKHNVIEKPKALGKNKYLEIEASLEQIGKRLDLSLAELDLYLWYMETGKVLK
jgi:N-glycosylase/DNA lyase